MKNMRLFTFIIYLVSILPMNAQNWSNTLEYEIANSQLPSLKNGEDRIVFLGNSITVGWLDTHPVFFENKPYVNRGISGQTTPQMLVRFRQDVIDIKASVVVILAGTNDIAENTGPASLDFIMGNIKSMVEIAKSNNIEVILCSVLPAYEYPWRRGLNPNIKIPKLNSIIKKYAEESGIYYLNYFDVLNDGNNGLIEDYTYDGVHLTLAGYKVLEPFVEKAITEVLKQK